MFIMTFKILFQYSVDLTFVQRFIKYTATHNYALLSSETTQKIFLNTEITTQDDYRVDKVK